MTPTRKAYSHGYLRQVALMLRAACRRGAVVSNDHVFRYVFIVPESKNVYEAVTFVTCMMNMSDTDLTGRFCGFCSATP
jgi:hypothetical protein